MGFFKRKNNQSSTLIVHGYPPNIEEIKKVFDLNPGTVFTYFPNIYVPEGTSLDVALMQHELTHVNQQKDIGPEKWWKRYLIDTSFRLSQEIPAYQVQYKQGMKIIKDRNKLALWLSRLAGELSGSLYGNMISFNDAMIAIREQKPYNFEIKW